MFSIALLKALSPLAYAEGPAPVDGVAPAVVEPESGRGDLAWAGVAFDSGLATGPAGTSVLVSQGEFDVQGTAGPLFMRLDLDLHVDPNTHEFGVPPALPEAAFLQVGRGTYRASVGVVNPVIGLQAWDAWDNYLPTFSSTWSFQNGQVAGVMPAVRFDNGAEVGVFGGRDLGWGDWTGGAYVASEQESYATWSGVSVWPSLEYYAVFPSVEVYPTAWLTLDLDAAAGLAGGNPFAGGALVFDFFPESEPNPVVRIEKMVDPGGKAGGFLELGVPDTAVSFALNTNPSDWVRLSAEGKMAWTDGAAEGSGVFYVAFHTPDPEQDFSTFEEAGE